MNNPIFYICNDPERALGLEKILPNFHIVCLDNSPIIKSIRESGVNIFSLGEELGQANFDSRNSYRLLQNKLAQEYIQNNSITAESINLIFFKISPRLEKLANSLNYNVLNTTSELNRLFENKISQYIELAKLKVGFPKQVIQKLGDSTYEQIQKVLDSEELVVQFDRGHTGNSTAFIKNKSEFDNLVNTNTERSSRIAKVITGEAWTINACVTREGTLYHGLSYQITGIPELTGSEGGTVGNDWSKVDQLSDSSKQQIISITTKVGEYMGISNYKGLFGLDFIIDKVGKVFLIEVNARQPASTGMHSKLMIKDGLMPLQLFHIAEFLFQNENDLEYFDYIKDIAAQFNLDRNIHNINASSMNPIQASQVLLRKQEDNNKNENQEIKETTKSGLYQNNTFISEAYSIDQLNNKNQHLLTTKNPNQKISTGDDLIRIQLLRNFEDKDINILFSLIH